MASFTSVVHNESVECFERGDVGSRWMLAGCTFTPLQSQSAIAQQQFTPPLPLTPFPLHTSSFSPLPSLPLPSSPLIWEAAGELNGR